MDWETLPQSLRYVNHFKPAIGSPLESACCGFSCVFVEKLLGCTMYLFLTILNGFVDNKCDAPAEEVCYSIIGG